MLRRFLMVLLVVAGLYLTAAGWEASSRHRESPEQGDPTPTPTATAVPWTDERQALVSVADRTTTLDLSGWDWDSGTALHGLMAAWRATGDPRYVQAVAQALEPHLAAGLPAITHPNHVTPGLALLDLYEATGEDRYLAAALRVGEAALALPRLDGPGLQSFAHAPGQAWVDTTYMTVPFLARLGGITGEAAWMDEAARQYLAHGELLQEPSGAFRHGWERRADGSTSPIGSLWLRGNAWAAAAGADLLAELPPAHSARGGVERRVDTQLAALGALQAESGRWPTVIDRFDFYEETSGGAGVAYALARSLDHGLLGSEFGPALARARSGLVARIDHTGAVRGVSVGTGPLPDQDAYNGMAVDQVQLWGQGLALLALAAPGNGLRLEAAPPSVTLAPGAQVVVMIRPSAVWGATGAISLSLAALDPGLDAELTDDGAGSGRLRLEVLPDAGSGELRARVVGIGGGNVGAPAGGAGSGDLGAPVVGAGSVVTSALEVLVRVAANPARAYIPMAARGTVRAVREVGPLEWSRADVAPDGSLTGIGSWGTMIRTPGDVARVLRPVGARSPARAPRTHPRHLAPTHRHPGQRLIADAGGEETQVVTWQGYIDGRWEPVFPPWPPELSFVAREPAPTADGLRAAVVTDVDCEPQPCLRLGVADLEGGDVQGVGPDGAIFPDWHPKSDLIALFRTRDEGASMVVWDVNDELPYVLGGATRTTVPPRWSPDGRWIALADPAGITIVDRFGAAGSSQGADSVAGVDWLADGKAVVFDAPDRSSSTSGRRTLHTMRVDLPPGDRSFPPPGLESDIARALDAFLEAHPLEEAFAAYEQAPRLDSAHAAIEEACHDWPDIPGAFGEGVHPAACRGWIAGYLALFHALGARRTNPPEFASFGFDQAEHDAWATAFLEVGLEYLADFVYGPGERPGAGYRDTRAAVWQNPQRAEHLLLAADLLRQRGRLDSSLEAVAIELSSGVARAWDATWWETGIAPSDGVTMTTATSTTTSLEGLRVGPAQGHYFEWDADAGNSPAEEVAWLGAGALLSAHIAANRDPRAPAIESHARHFVAYAVAYDRQDGVRGVFVRTLNERPEGEGATLERPFWIENHFAGVPSVPYAGSVWDSLNMALIASTSLSPSLAPDNASWRAHWGSAEETVRDADGALIVDFARQSGTGYALGRHPDWITACGVPDPSRPYVSLDSGGEPVQVSEIGHGAGVDLLAMGVGLMMTAQMTVDDEVAVAWQARTRELLRAMASHPPDPAWARCKTAVHVSANRAYHTARIAAGYLVPLLAASGYEVESW